MICGCFADHCNRSRCPCALPKVIPLKSWTGFGGFGHILSLLHCKGRFSRRLGASVEHQAFRIQCSVGKSYNEAFKCTNVIMDLCYHSRSVECGLGFIIADFHTPVWNFAACLRAYASSLYQTPFATYLVPNLHPYIRPAGCVPVLS